MRFTVWAPLAGTVQVLTRGGRFPLSRDDRGWWSAEEPAAVYGDDYQFMLDGGPPRPDPRSPWQPLGVSGPSRLVDHSRYAWRDARWQAPPLADGVIYELHVGTFTAGGTFDAAIDRLDYLADLGVTHIELMPVNEFSGERGWGYDGVDLFAPHHAYGGPDGLKRLVDACHERGLAVLLDVVYNHLGPSGNYLGEFGPYFTDRYRTPWGKAVNFDDAESDEVRRFVCDNALMWLREYHCDGLRIDAVHAIADQSALHILEELAQKVGDLERQLQRRLVCVAESDLNDPRLVRPQKAGGYGLDAQWSDDFHHALHAVLTGERQGYYADFGTLADLAAACERPFVYDGKYSVYRRRRHGRDVSGLSGHRFVVCQQNHDQVGNRAAGDRIGRIAGLKRQKIGAALLLTCCYVPLIFQGEEWGAQNPFLYFTDHAEKELAQAVREGRRSEFKAFGWPPEVVPDPQDSQTFRQSKLNWDDLALPQHKDMLAWYRQLIGLRRGIPKLRDGCLESVRTTFDELSGWLQMDRQDVRTLCNFSGKASLIPMEPGPVWKVLAASEAVLSMTSESIELSPESAVILRRGDPS